ncbi:MAG: amidohydrolase [Kiritimatiellae bacterium]|nr:amidohydrolase [Kiritimatiellia bacterium]
MTVCDSHCHVSPYWYEPVESLLFHMDRNGVEQAVLVQYMGQYDNAYQFDCARDNPGRFASVVLVDARKPAAVEELERLAARGAAGVRLRPDTRSPGDDPLAIWRKAEELGLAVSCSGDAGAFAADAFAEVVRAVPKLPIVLEHLGAVNTPDAEAAPNPLRQRVFALARFPNVYIKFHGLGEICRRTSPVEQPFPFKRDGLRILEMAHEAFGPDRMMWGSDYPPVSGREGYANALRLAIEPFGEKSEEEREKMFGGTARRVFGLV